MQVRSKLVPAKRRAEAGQGTTWRALAQDDLKARLAASSVHRKAMSHTMPKDQWDLEKKYGRMHPPPQFACMHVMWTGLYTLGSCDLKCSLLCVNNPMNVKKNVHNVLVKGVEQQFAACMMLAHHVPARHHEALLVTSTLASL
jgi:hypothetical protein